MKALPMLDHVMLWVARGFAAYAAFFGFCLFLFQGLFKGDLIFCGSLLLTTVVWVACTWSLSHRTSRLFLGITSGLYLVGLLFITANMPKLPPVSETTFYVLPAVGAASMIWVSIRNSVNSVCLP